MEKKWERDMDRPSVPQKPQNRYIQRWKTSVIGSAGGALSYQVGDRVRHIKFGDGEVMAIVSGGRDYEVTVDFDKVGTKKMFASFAKLKKI